MPEKFILTLSSSQIESFLTCATLWHYQYQMNLSTKRENQRPHVSMDKGTYGHRLLEIIYKERARGNYKGALEVAFSYDLDASTCRCGHSVEKHEFGDGQLLDQTTPNNCLSTGCSCDLFVPVPFPLDKQERESVKQRVLEYTFAEGAAFPELRARSPESVEVGFSQVLYEDESRLYILEGRIDFIGQIANNVELGWADHKFQDRRRDLYLKSIQFRNYSQALEMPIGVVNYIRFAAKFEKETTFKRSVISFSRAEIQSWRSNLIQIYKKVEEAVNQPSVPEYENQWYDPMDSLRNRSACSGRFGYPCDYTPLCEEFNNPQLIQLKEKSDFDVREPWRSW